jgi:hypothetical protein
LIAGRCQLQQPVILLWCNVIVEIIHRIHGVAIAVDLIVAVWPGTFAGAAYPADDLPALNLLTGGDFNFHHMAIQRGITIAMVDDDVVAITVAGVAGDFHRAVGRSIDRSPLRGGKVKAGMELRCFIDRIDPIAEPGGDPAEVFVADRLDGRRAGQELLLILDEPIDLGIGFSLVGHPGAQLVKGVSHRSIKILLVHAFYQLDLLFLFGGFGPGAVRNGCGLENGPVDIIVPFFKLTQLVLHLLDFIIQGIIIILQGVIALHEPLFVGGREVFIGDGDQDEGGNNSRGQEPQYAQQGYPQGCLQLLVAEGIGVIVVLDLLHPATMYHSKG